MYSKGKNYNLKEWFEKGMKEMGFEKGVEEVEGYYRDEAEWNTIADYISSCGLETEEDIAFMKSLGYVENDFCL